MTEDGLFVCESSGMNMWDDSLTGDRLWLVHDVEEEV